MLIVVSACQKKEDPTLVANPLLLSDIIIGSWDLIAQKGFPYDREEFEFLNESNVNYKFETNDSATVQFYIQGVVAEENTGPYIVDDTRDTILMVFRGFDSLYFDIIEFSEDEMIREFPQDEDRGW